MFDDTIKEITRLYFIYGLNCIPVNEYKGRGLISLESLNNIGIIERTGNGFKIGQRAITYISNFA